MLRAYTGGHVFIEIFTSEMLISHGRNENDIFSALMRS